MCLKKASDSIIDDWEPPCGCSELNQGLLEEQPVLLTALLTTSRASVFSGLWIPTTGWQTEQGNRAWQSSGSGMRSLFYMYSKAMNSKPTVLPQITNKNYTETSFLASTASNAFYTNFQFIRKWKIKTLVE